jgi:hypothetical protein
MKEVPSLIHVLRSVAQPKFILLALALFNFLAVHNRYGGECAYNLSDAYREFFILFVAALALWVERWWGYLGSAVLSGKAVYSFGYVVLKIFRLLPPGAGENWIAPEEWVRIMVNNPFEPFQGILAASIFTSAAISLVRSVFRRRVFLP